jgi:hypothetical protein
MTTKKNIKSAGLNNRDWFDVSKALEKVNEGQAIILIRKLLPKLQGTSDQLIHDLLIANCWKLKAIADGDNAGTTVSIYNKEDMEIAWTEPAEEKEEIKCSKCETPISSENYDTEDEPREYWGATVHERVAVGYTCPNCKHKENF